MATERFQRQDIFVMGERGPSMVNEVHNLHRQRVEAFEIAGREPMSLIGRLVRSRCDRLHRSRRPGNHPSARCCRQFPLGSKERLGLQQAPPETQWKRGTCGSLRSNLPAEYRACARGAVVRASARRPGQIRRRPAITNPHMTANRGSPPNSQPPPSDPYPGCPRSLHRSAA